MNQHRLRSILAATDLEAGSDAILSAAAAIAARTGAPLHIVHSLDLPWEPAEDVARSAAFREEVATARERMHEQVELTTPAAVEPASQSVIPYSAGRAIVERAEQVSADLIVLGPHRGGAAGAYFLGTTADRVIRTAEVPCLVVREPLADAVRRIGVAIDFSDPSRGALETALAWSAQAGGPAGAGPTPLDVRVVYVGWPVESIDNPTMEEDVIRPRLESEVALARERIGGAGEPSIAIDVLWANDPTEALVAWVHRLEIDLLVIGTHGRTGLKRALIGSMASRLARRTPCPVLLVPPGLWSGHPRSPQIDDE